MANNLPSVFIFLKIDDFVLRKMETVDFSGVYIISDDVRLSFISINASEKEFTR